MWDEDETCSFTGSKSFVHVKLDTSGRLLEGGNRSLNLPISVFMSASITLSAEEEKMTNEEGSIWVSTSLSLSFSITAQNGVI